MEETAEFQVGVDDTARRRRLNVNKRKAIVQGEVEPVPVREAVKCYCQCMQIMLQASSQQQHALTRNKTKIKMQERHPQNANRKSIDLIMMSGFDCLIIHVGPAWRPCHCLRSAANHHRGSTTNLDSPACPVWRTERQPAGVSADLSQSTSTCM